jgi:DNA replication ATP-dependent helicase Dna2
VFFGEKHATADKTTPQADPAADLWKQYANGKASDDSTKIADFEQLIFQASPKKLETPVKSAGLRRWASTGNDWPTSKTKRRRTNGKTTINFLQEQHDVELAGKSKVAAMVERLQESLASQKLARSPPKPEVMVQAPSSSSPLPEVDTKMQDYPSASPLQGKAPVEQPAVQQKTLQAAEPANVAHHHLPRQSPKLSPITIPVEAKRFTVDGDVLPSAPLQLQSKAPLPAFRRPTIKRTTSGGRQYPQRAQPVLAHPPPPPKAPDSDEFGDDLDLSAEDFDVLMTQQPPLHQRPLDQLPAHPNPPPQQDLNRSSEHRSALIQGRVDQPIVIDEFDDDDEFGCDDLDEAVLMQAEISATQAVRASLPDSNHTHGRRR